MGPTDPERDLHFDVHDGEGPYLLLVHGFLSSRAQWLLNLEGLCRFSRPVVAELLGHGRSPAPESSAPYLPQGYVEAFEKIRGRLGAKKWFVCGQSLGAALTLYYALDRPEVFRGHIMTNSNSAFRQIENREQAIHGAEYFAQRLMEEGKEGIQGIPVHPIHARSLHPHIREALLQDGERLSLLGVVNTIRYTQAGFSLREECAKNRVPTLLVCGRREKRFQPLRDYAAAHMPFLEIVDLEGGHAVNVDAAQAFNQAVQAFMAQH